MILLNHKVIANSDNPAPFGDNDFFNNIIEAMLKPKGGEGYIFSGFNCHYTKGDEFLAWQAKNLVIEWKGLIGLFDYKGNRISFFNIDKYYKGDYLGLK